VIREYISNGTPRMTGFRYYFEPGQISSIVQYIKTIALAGLIRRHTIDVEMVSMAGPRQPELLFSFLTFKLSAKGVVAILLALPVALILTAIAWRIFHG